MRHSTHWPASASTQLLTWRNVQRSAMCLLTFSLLLAAGASAQLPTKPMSPANGIVLMDGVVLDSEQTTLYLMNPDGGLDAVEAATGDLLWTTTAAAKPLAVLGDHLIAQADAKTAGELPLVVLDRRGGDVVRTTHAELPGEVFASIDDGPRRTFRVRAAAGDGGLNIAWLATQLTKKGRFQGYIPSPEEELNPESQAPQIDAKAQEFLQLEGVVRFDPVAGKAASLADVKPAVKPGMSGLREVTLLGDVAGRQFLSTDGRHVLVSEARSDGGPWDRYLWTIYTRSGELVGQLRHRTSMSPFVVTGETLLVESRAHVRLVGGEMVDRPLELAAIDLASGQGLWTKTVRLTEFEGPFPP